MKTEEVGYFGHFSDLRATLDIRAYRERMFGVIDTQSYTFPGYALRRVDDSVNYQDFETHGIEFQWRWKPFAETEIWLNHNEQSFRWTRNRFNPANTSHSNNIPPQHTSSIAWFQKLPQGVDLAVIYSTTSEMTWRNQAKKLKPIGRTDVRLAYPFRIGATKAEVAVTVQALGGDYVAYYPEENFPRLLFERRAFGTLRLEF